MTLMSESINVLQTDTTLFENFKVSNINMKYLIFVQNSILKFIIKFKINIINV